MEIVYSPKFNREYKKLPLKVKILAEDREPIFRRDPFKAILKVHKLKGKLKDFWAFSIDYKYRIIFEFKENNIVYFHSVGGHDIYDR